MRINASTIVKYLISLLIAAGLLYVVFKDVDLTSLLADLKRANYLYIFLSIFFAVASHLARAARWNLLLEPLGYRPALYRTFCAVMVGYFANLLVPRMGEVSRCGILQRTDKIPLNGAFGTVIAERAFDLIILLLCVFAVIAMQFSTLGGFFSDLISQKATSAPSSFNALSLVIFVAVVLLVITGLLLLFRGRIVKAPFYSKAASFVSGLWAGVRSIRRVKNKKTFFFYTICIWALYFAMTYIMFFALEETSSLGLMAGLAMMAIGGVGMAAPVPGGTGSFHILVSRALILYGIPKTVGVSFATLLHSSQFIMMVVVGGICFFATLTMGRRSSELDDQPDPILHEQYS